MYGHTGGGHVGGGHVPPAHHQPHRQVHSADNWTSMDARPQSNSLATRIRNPKLVAVAAIGVVLALLILLVVAI